MESEQICHRGEMNDLREKLAAASRPKLLRFIAEGIHGLTVMARDPDMSEPRKAQINNQIHYLAGRLMRLLDDEVACTEVDLDDIVTQTAGMNPTLSRNMVSRLSR